MNIVKMFNDFLSLQDNLDNSFSLFLVYPGFYVGIDDQLNPVVVCKAHKSSKTPIRQRTKLLSIECNILVEYSLNSKIEEDVVHIIRCFSSNKKERDVFIELSPLFYEAGNEDDQESALIELVSILSSFFENKHEPSDAELQGLYAELYTIYSYNNDIQLGNYWHSSDRLKFDFSIDSENKIEVKSTMKTERKHRFKHNQLSHNNYNIYVVSYMFRPDDEGLSLSSLIELVKPSVESNVRKLMILEKYIKNTSEERLDQLKFDEVYTKNMRKIFKAKDVPQFEEKNPEGVSNAEYDCLLENVPSMDETEFVARIMEYTKEIENIGLN